MKKQILILALTILAIGVKAQAPDASTLTRVGDMAPTFSFSTAKDKTADIKDYRGKIVLLNFWATWCPPCRAELPRVQKEIWEKYKDNPKFAMFAFAREEGWEKVLPFKEQNKYTFAMLPDEGRAIFKLYATQSIPRNVVLDENGRIIYQSIGYSPAEFDVLLKLLDTKLKAK
ncbi:TlpA family protein disulfide reductase [Mucilaginibacter mali]|uniref:TlpA family protein disulfide reductase n=1 Tax=Mucilaginibacter mali TaxID=2740462 RepID=A0A7D4Q7N3_9SPHI|nr:TlpA disulfide reductase family protein [Mucilaginibacter mali]QKJ29265.1 TlpA family protein disulfide reductase [Mucilaginibacter mali]